MRRVVLALVVAAMLALSASPVFAEGHICRWWWPDPESGYWVWNVCGEAWRWYAEIPWYEWTEAYGVHWLEDPNNPPLYTWDHLEPTS
jgi:hypothetical protein